MSEMIKFLTKKFSHHTLTEVKPAENGSASTHPDDRPIDRRVDVQHERTANSTINSNHGNSNHGNRLSLDSFSEEEGEEPEDEEISTINLSSETRTHPKPVPKQENEQRFCPERSKHSPPTRNLRVTPPLKQFEMRLPDIEVERKYDFHTTIKPRKFIRANNQMLKQFEINRQSPLHLRRPAFIDYAKETKADAPIPRPSAFIRIPHIEGAKIHPRSSKHHSQKEKRNSKELSPLAEKIVISAPAPARQEASHSDSEVSDSRSRDNELTSNNFTYAPKRSGSFTGKKSPTPSLSLLDRRSSPVALIKERFSPPVSLTKGHVTPPIIKDRNTPSPPHYEYKCISTLEHMSCTLEHCDSMRTVSPLTMSRSRISPIHNRVPMSRDNDVTMLRDIDVAMHKDKAIKSLDRINQLHDKKREVLLGPAAENKKREVLLGPAADTFTYTAENKKFAVERILHGKSCNTEKTEVEMVESFENDRNFFHKQRINTAYNNDLKRKYSVVPVDDEVRSICAATSKSNFKAAFILTTNPSQSGLNHRTIDISVVRPNKRVCCTDPGHSPPAPRRPSINVEKMAQTILIRRPLVRKAGQPSRVWSTKEKPPKPSLNSSQFRPLHSQFSAIPSGSCGT